jgi:hypothetical protein
VKDGVEARGFPSKTSARTGDATSAALDLEESRAAPSTWLVGTAVERVRTSVRADFMVPFFERTARGRWRCKDWRLAR